MGHDAQGIDAVLADFARRPNVPMIDDHLREAMTLCIERGLDRLPVPGSGQTLLRWQQLAAVGGIDLALLKLYEGHTDALAILQELACAPFTEPGIWGVWAAEPPSARVGVSARNGDEVRLNGRKAWCSGAQQIDYALITAWTADDQPQLVAVRLDQPGITIDAQAWQAVGMATTASVDVHFDSAVGHCVGESGAYLSRPGFWQGGAGIAAAWYGAAASLARTLHRQRQQGRPDPHADAHLGSVDAALHGASAALHACAAWIDAHPEADARLSVQRVRAQVEMAVEHVCRHVGRALGATPFCRDPQFARLAVDLPVFIRQSHAERDLAQLGELLAARETEDWSL
ncbi:acyl-CoA dehydrogenase family protein [Pseudomonas sp. SLFW]|uniref:acyl-CoA dehydrogenase family protein n=1 Tax=Pseudomonas sp. SLFW TaxID=2683259 RepID=UPI0014128C01|nr:acyl-CoA dehydrogenase [Pseudomonas sp. SLFW]